MDVDAILDKLRIKQINDAKEAFKILTSSLAVIRKTLGEDNVNRFKGLMRVNFFELNEKEREFLWENVNKHSFIDQNFVYGLQRDVQKILTPFERRRLAAYYTKDIGLDVMAESTALFLEKYPKNKIVLADFFLGSGLTLSKTIEKVGRKHFSMVLGVEPHPLAALVAYASLLYLMKGDVRRIRIIVGDFFQLAYMQEMSNSPYDEKTRVMRKADVILTNPPFTRWETLNEKYRKFLKELIKKLGYKKYVIRGQLNLQLISLFLMDYFLNDHGLLVSVLPASTFYTTSGESIKNLLKEKYKVLGMIESSSETAFSTDSGFKELITVCIKEEDKFHETAFICLNKTENIEGLSKLCFGRIPNEETLKSCIVNCVNLHKVSGIWDMNWLVFFRNNELKRLLHQIFSHSTKQRTIASWNNVFGRKFLVRGVEIYGPDFFFIPNKFWKIVNDTCGKVIIRNEKLGKEFSIERKYLKATLRRPALYSDKILVRPEHYFLVISPVELDELPSYLVEYLNWGKVSGVAKSAVKGFGKYWYSHVFRQIKTKKPFGKVFLPDKVDSKFKNRGVFANYSDVPMMASKNFYIIKIDDDKVCKVLAAWFNSTFFISLLLVAGRKISEHWTRFLGDDYLKLPIPNVKILSEENVRSICKSIEEIATRKLPSLPYQLDEEYRVKLDVSLAKAIGLPDPQKIVEKLHTLLREYWKM